MDLSNVLYFDIEANGLLREATVIHCIALRIGGKEKLCTSKADIEMAVRVISQHDGPVVGHNTQTFDFPLLQRFYPGFKIPALSYDTLLLGCILDPEAGILSLDAWAQRLRLPVQKVQHEDWSVYTDNMGHRCLKDTEINEHVFKHIVSMPHFPLVGDASELENRVANIHARQTLKGVYFNLGAADDLWCELHEKRGEVKERIVENAPWKVRIPGVAIKNLKSHKEGLHDGINPFKQDGTYTVNTQNYFGPQGYRKVRGPYTKVDLQPFNPDSSTEVQQFLLSLGWQPIEWNTKRDKMTGEVKVTSPKLTEESYVSLPPGVGQDIALYNTLSHRFRWLLSKDGKKGALKNVREDGRVTAEAFTCGTNTARYRHQGTVCNIPRVTTPYGKEMRGVFGVPPGRVQVGVDLSGIEARMLAHFLLKYKFKKGKETAALILSPDKKNDFHSFNALQWDVSRDIAKNVLYALMYGAGAKKLAATAGKAEGKGAKLKRDFYKVHPGIKELNEALERAYDSKGFILGIDGRPLYIRQKNRLLNTLLQNAATIVFKKWMVRLDEIAQEPEFKGKVHQIIAYHDEVQYECDPEVAQRWASVCEGTARWVGKEMGLAVPIAAEAKCGVSWAECH